jgi:hypothetical protein
MIQNAMQFQFGEGLGKNEEVEGRNDGIASEARQFRRELRDLTEGFGMSKAELQMPKGGVQGRRDPVQGPIPLEPSCERSQVWWQQSPQRHFKRVQWLEL